MKQLPFQEKYPVTVVDVQKSETTYSSAEEVAGYFRDCIENTPRVKYLTTFDHLAHTREIDGEVLSEIQAAINVVCEADGPAIRTSDMTSGGQALHVQWKLFALRWSSAHP